jgi:hypothetical protein
LLLCKFFATTGKITLFTKHNKPTIITQLFTLLKGHGRGSSGSFKPHLDKKSSKKVEKLVEKVVILN